MTLHPRTVNVNRARAVIAEAITKASTEYELTYPELLFILTDELQSYAADAVRESRKSDA